METTMPTVRDLFGAPIVFQVPNYQRPYVWNEFDQWEPLWLDVIEIADGPPDASEQYDAAARKPHFLGAAVLKELPSVGVGDAKRYAVVDGQQRITTIQLLLTAVADTFREHEGLEQFENHARALTINMVMGVLIDTEPNKIRPLARNFHSFTDLMKASRARDDKQVEKISGPIGDCYRFFRRRASKWLEENSRLPVQQRAHALLTAMCQKLQVVAIYLSPDENESAIFEALNARGEPLSEWEKVKNHILFKAGETAEIDQGALYKRHLSTFDDDPQWLDNVRSGTTSRRRSDQFLDYWLESKLHKIVDARRVFREFRSELDIRATPKVLEDWSQELREDGEYFLHWETTSEWDGDVETIFHGRRRTLSIGLFWPLLLALARARRQHAIKCTDMGRCLRALDSFLWRRAIAGRQTQRYPIIALDLLKALPKDPTASDGMPFSDAMIEQFSQYSPVHSAWPKDHEVRQAVLERSMTQMKNLGVLSAIERGILRGKYAGNERVPAGLSIEHIMPRTRTGTDWALPLDAGEEAEDERERHVHLLGNLTLVDPNGLNPKLSNRPWTEKRRILQEQDNLYINKDLLNHAPNDRWDEEQIRLRGKRLADYIVKIWPYGHAVRAEIEKLNT